MDGIGHRLRVKRVWTASLVRALGRQLVLARCRPRPVQPQYIPTAATGRTATTSPSPGIMTNWRNKEGLLNKDSGIFK